MKVVYWPRMDRLILESGHWEYSWEQGVLWGEFFIDDHQTLWISLHEYLLCERLGEL